MVIFYVHSISKDGSLVRTAIIYKGKRKETQKDRQLVFKKANKDNKVAIEEGIRSELGKPTGELTKADLEKVRELYMPNDEITNLEALSGMTNLEQLSLWNNQITNLTPLAGLKGLKRLIIYDNPNLTKTQINKLQQALPKCKVIHNVTK